MPHLAQLFILAFQAGAQTEEELVRTVGQFLYQSSDGLVRNGVRMDAEETSNLVRASAARFLRHDWPLLMALQVLDEYCGDDQSFEVPTDGLRPK